jgi:NTP pyrophosphatase (non-canonical NTP hydrolase)
MNFAQYPALAARTEKELPTRLDRLEHAALGLVTETGEIATIVKRIKIYGKSLDSLVEKGPDAGKSFRALIAEEMGDVLWYLPIVTREFGVSDEVFGTMDSAEFLEPQEGLPAIALDKALASVSRRLSIAAATVANFVEDEFIAQQTQVDLGLAVGTITTSLANLAWLIGADLRQVAADNIAKLKLRYPEKYSDVAAEARADKGGEDARNS